MKCKNCGIGALEESLVVDEVECDNCGAIFDTKDYSGILKQEKTSP